MKGPGLLILTGIGVLLWWEPGLVGLHVEDVIVCGCRHLSPTVSESLAASYHGCTMGISTCRSLERAFTRLPIVESAQAIRVWPDTLKLLIRERPLIARASDHDVSFDIGGNQYRHLAAVSESLPDLVGWSAETNAGWSQAFDVLAIVQNATPGLFFGSWVAGPPLNGSFELDSRSGNIRILLPCPADHGLADRLEYLPVVLADARSKGEAPSTADLRWLNQIILGFGEMAAKQ